MIAGVVLAAGGSRRLGRPKQLVSVGGRSLVQHAADCCLAGGCKPVRVVLGASFARIRPRLQDLPVELLRNEDWQEGIASSMRIGVRELPAGVEAVLLATCDQPRLSPGVVRRLIAAFDGSPGGSAACEYAGTVGVPALFGAGRFEELLALRGDHGAKKLLLSNPGSLARVPWPDGAVDLDCPEDLDRI